MSDEQLQSLILAIIVGVCLSAFLLVTIVTLAGGA